MKGYSVCGEGPHHIEVMHQDGTRMKIAKHHLDMKMMAKLSTMPRVEHDDEGTQDVGATDPNGTVPNYMASSDPTATMPNAAAQYGVGGTMDDNSIAPAIDPSLNAAPQDSGPAPDAAVGSQTFPTPTGAPPDVSQTTAPATPPGSPQQSLIDQALGEAKSANTEKANADAALANRMVGIQTKANADLATAQADSQKNIAANIAENKQITDSISNAKIDPSRYWNNSSTGAKVGMLAGILVSGLGSGLTGKPNMALDVIQKNIDRDVDSQQANLGKQKTLLEANLRRYGDLNQAIAATRLNITAATQGQINLAAAQNGSAQALASAHQANAQLDIQAMPSRIALAQYQAGQQAIANTETGAGGSNAGYGGGGYNLDKLTALKYAASTGSKAYDPKDLDDASKEAGVYDSANKGMDNISNQFDMMENNRGSILTKDFDWLPDVLKSDKTRNYDVGAGTLEVEMSKLLGERPNPALMDRARAQYPIVGDSPAILQQKKTQLLDIYKKAASEKANGFQASRRLKVISPSNPLLNSVYVNQ